MSNVFKYLILPIILFIAVFVAAFWILWPLWNDTQAAISLKEANGINLAQRKKLSTNLEYLINQYNERATDLTFFSKAIPVGQNTPELLVSLEAIASESGLIFSGVNFKPKDLKNTSNIKSLGMEVKLKGSYVALQNYLKNMEKSLRIFDVVNISFNGVAPGQTAANPNSLDFNLLINTYYQ